MSNYQPCEDAYRNFDYNVTLALDLPFEFSSVQDILGEIRYLRQFEPEKTTDIQWLMYADEVRGERDFDSQMFFESYDIDASPSATRFLIWCCLGERHE